jgi:hypothetical protein
VKYRKESEDRWEPPQASAVIEEYLTGVKEHLYEETERIHKLRYYIQHKCSSPPWLITALEQIKKDRNIIITEADKNMGTVVIKTKAYVEEGLRQLNDRNTYVTCEAPDFIKLFEELEGIWKKHHMYFIASDMKKKPEDRKLSKVAKYLLQLKGHSKCKLGCFYMLMKVHKPILAGRPIVSSIDTVTYFASKYLDRILQPIYKNISSYIESSQALIGVLDGWRIKSSPDCYILCADIDSLYPNIPLKEGLEYMRKSLIHHNERLKEHKMPVEMIDFICDLMSFVLNNNYFTFGENLIFKQINGTAMGTPAAVVFACLFLDHLERQVLKQMNPKPKFYKRYIDDLFVVCATENEAKSFITLFNSMLPTIKCSSPTISNTDGIFLDLFIFKGNRFEKDKTFDTKIYQKPQNKYLYLTPNSFHPKAVFPAFIVSELNRYRLCCNNEEDFIAIKDEFYKRLLDRGYQPSLLDQLFTKWTPRDKLLQDIKNRIFSAKVIKDSDHPVIFKSIYLPEIKYFRLGKCLHLTDGVKRFDTTYNVFAKRNPLVSHRNSSTIANFFRQSRKKLNNCNIEKFNNTLVCSSDLFSKVSHRHFEISPFTGARCQNSNSRTPGSSDPNPGPAMGNGYKRIFST